MLLREKDKNQIISIVKNNISIPFKLLAFGSRVNGDAHDTSDLDLVIISKEETAIEISELSNIKEKIIDSSIPILVEIFDWYRIPKSFHQNIINNHKTLIEVD